jgi:hypothetical protein
LFNSAKGYARLRTLYDDYNRLIESVYYDDNNAQLVKMVNTYDERGNCISNAMYNRQNELQADREHGVAKNVYSYDEYGYVIGQEWFDADGEPMSPYGLYSKYLRTRENGRTTKIEYFDEVGELTLNQDGYAFETFTYDERGNETGRAFFDADGKPVLLRWRFSRYEVKYDEQGNIAESTYFDTVDREVEQVDGHLAKTEAFIRNIPQRILAFIGNDGSSLMGEIEIKLYTPLSPQVEPISMDAELMQDGNQDFPDENIPVESQTEEQDVQDFSEREYLPALNSYVRALEQFDGVKVMDAMDQSLTNATAIMVATQLNVEITENKIYHFYASFYSSELDLLKSDLYEKYGEDIYITYEISAEEYQPTEAIVEANKAMQDSGIEALEIQEMVSLYISFSISGSIMQGIEQEGFFSSPFVLLKINDRWGIGSGEGFPKPSTNDLVELYTGN